MKRRVCETCFFFESAGINNSGWCRHPERQFAAGVRLVVRGNEIACRNGWDADSWVSAEIDPNGTEASAADTMIASGGSDEITSILPARYDPPSPNPPPQPATTFHREDIVVGHAPFPGYVAPEKDARDLVTNPRAAILRAREQFKSRQKREGRIADYEQRPPLIVDATNDFPASDWNLHEDDREDWGPASREDAPFPSGQFLTTSPRVNIVPPVSREEMQRPYPTITSFAEDAERFESIPDDHLDFADSSPAEDDADFRFNDVYEDDLAPFDGYADDRYDIEQDYVVAAPRPRRESLFERFRRERRERKAPMPVDESTTSYDDEFYDDIPLASELYRATPEAPTTFYSSHEEIDVAESHAMANSYVVGRRSISMLDQETDELRDSGAGIDARKHTEQRTVSRPYQESGVARSVPELTINEPTSGRDLLFHQMDVDAELENQISERHDSRHEEWPDGRFEPEPRRRAPQRSIAAPALARRHNERSFHRPLMAHESTESHRQQRGSNSTMYYDDVQLDDTDDVIADLPRWNDSMVDRGAWPAKPAPATPPIATGVPRICRTCRDFRPSENPDRGWCNNAWAFSHRRMVDAESLSCGQSALGPWWTANDNYWQGPGDVARHAQETPLLDRLLASRFDRYDDHRRASGGGRG